MTHDFFQAQANASRGTSQATLPTLTGAGTVSADAAALTERFTNISGAANSGVRLPRGNLGPADCFRVYNSGANTVKVYAPTGGQVNAGGVDVAMSVATLVLKQFWSINGLDWAAM